MKLYHDRYSESVFRRNKFWLQSKLTFMPSALQPVNAQ